MSTRVNEDCTALSDADRYAIWCDEVRLLFGGSMNGSAQNLVDQDSDCASCRAANTSGSEVNPGKHYDEDYFPYCFYTRMLSTSRRSNPADELDDDINGSCYSSVSNKLRVDEDALAERLTSKLKVQLRTLNIEKTEKNVSVPESEPFQWPFRDASVEVLAASVNQELHELRMYVRQHNLMADQLRRQLLESRRLIQLERG